MMSRYIKFESQKKRANDCVIRALMKLTNKSWVECYDELCELGRKYKRMPDEIKIIEAWLIEHGFEKWTYGRIKKGQRRTSVSEFASDHKTGSYFLNLTGHVVACVDGYYYDSWDSGYCKVLSYYEKI